MAAIYEYSSPKKLEGSSRYFIKIPESIVLDEGPDGRLVTAFSFFSIAKGLDGNVMFSLNGMAQWCGKKPDRHSNGINSKLEKSVIRLETLGYVSLYGGLSNARCCMAGVDIDKINDECDNMNFAIVYVDEVRKMLEWENPNPKDAFMSSDILLRVFAYLRMLIRRRPNKLPLGECDIEKRRSAYPEAWNGYYDDMAEDMGISARLVSDAVEALCGMGLLCIESLPRTRLNGKWRTSHTIFCNAYKREGQLLLEGGKDYCMREIENKKKLLRVIGRRTDADVDGGV